MKKFSLVVALALAFGGPLAARPQDDARKLPDAIAAARKLVAQGKFKEADDALDAVAKEAFGSAEAMMIRARVSLDLGDWGKGLTFADQAVKLTAEKDADAHFLSAKCCANMGDEMKALPNKESQALNYYTNAVASFDKGLKIKADDADALWWKGSTLLSLDRAKDAAEALEKSVKIAPGNAAAWLQLAKAHTAAQNNGKAVEAAGKGLLAKELSDDTSRELAGIVSSILGPAGKNAEAFELMKAWSGAHPESAPALLWMGYYKKVDKQYDEAMTCLAKSFAVSNKTYGAAAWEYANAAQLKGDVEKAAEWYAMAQKVQPEWPPQSAPLNLIVGLAHANYVLKNDFKSGIALIEKYAVPLADKDWSTHNVLGLFYRDWADSARGDKSGFQEKNEQSLKHYLKASELIAIDDSELARKNRAAVYNDTGVIYDYQMKQLEKGLEWYRKAVKADPEWGDACENMGVSLNKLGKHEEAIGYFETVLKKEPGRNKSVHGLATAKKALEKK